MEVYLCTDPELLRQLREAGLNAHSLGGETMPDMREGQVTVVSRGGSKEAALGLRSRGIADTRLNYADIPGDIAPGQLLRMRKHLFWDDVRPLSEFHDDTSVRQSIPSGFAFMDENLKFRWRIPELCIVAGPYGSGKSLLAQILAIEFARHEGQALGSGTMLCSWEDLALNVKRGVTRYAASHGEKPAKLLDNVHFVRRDPSEDRLIAWYMDLVRYHRQRYGTRFFVLDPWNEVDHVKDVRQAETDYVKDMMKAFRRLVDKLQIILCIVTHVPAKSIKGNGEIEPFRLAHAFGSVQFANKADRGLCVVRTQSLGSDHMIIRQDKAKDEEVMGIKATVACRYDRDTHSLDYDPVATAAVQDVWKG